MKVNYSSLIHYLIVATGIVVIACTAAVEKKQLAKQPAICKAVSSGTIRAGYFQSIAEYKKEVAEQMAENDVLMFVFKADLARESKSGNSYYINLIADLEQKSRDLKNKLETYAATDLNGWQKFKENFDAELDELSYTYKSLGIKKTN